MLVKLTMCEVLYINVLYINLLYQSESWWETNTKWILEENIMKGLFMTCGLMKGNQQWMMKPSGANNNGSCYHL